jgi:hypothetical protein
MVTTSEQGRASILMLLVGVVAGAVGGWSAHRAPVVSAGAASGSSARSEVVAQQSESSARQSLPANSARAPSVESTKVASGSADPAREETPLYSAQSPPRMHQPRGYLNLRNRPHLRPKRQRLMIYSTQPISVAHSDPEMAALGLRVSSLLAMRLGRAGRSIFNRSIMMLEQRKCLATSPAHGPVRCQ